MNIINHLDPNKFRNYNMLHFQRLRKHGDYCIYRIRDSILQYIGLIYLHVTEVPGSFARWKEYIIQKDYIFFSWTPTISHFAHRVLPYLDKYKLLFQAQSSSTTLIYIYKKAAIIEPRH